MEKTYTEKWLFDDTDLAPVDLLWEALCCPCVVYGRSKSRFKDARQRGHDYDSSHVKFKVGKKGIIDTHEESHSKATTCDTEPDENLPCIPEGSSEGTSPTSTSSASSRSKPRERSIAQDPVAPIDATLDHSHDLSRDPKGPLRANAPHKLRDDTSNPTYPPSIHQLRTDTKAPASPPAVHRHDLFHDASEAVPTQTNHDIGFDRVETYRASPDHLLLQDEKTPGAFPTSSHHLHHDAVTRTKSPRPHKLEGDGQVASTSTHRPHHLHDDK
ncbi:integral membrane protein [Fusarium beomiforme]|uniref:Integral membrane protein n=1 Tax=Fusarium beomiforme TaxID=44412 RepID=A0A9P5AD80_9HYPO|nr:integral membrane protein [Fusarium beomiforme]